MSDFSIPGRKGYEFKCCLCGECFKVGDNRGHEEIDSLHAENIPETPNHSSEICNNCNRDEDDKGFLKPSSITPR